jgi:hypothetical protein
MNLIVNVMKRVILVAIEILTGQFHQVQISASHVKIQVIYLPLPRVNCRELVPHLTHPKRHQDVTRKLIVPHQSMVALVMNPVLHADIL